MPDASGTTVKAPSYISANRTIILQLSLIIGLGVFLRFYGLSRESLWLDELSTFRAGSYPTISQMISQWAAPNVHPPAYYIIIWILQKLWADSEFVLRLPSAVAGVLAIPAIFLLGKKLFSHREGLIAAGLLAVLWCPVFYSQEAKAYQILLLFVIIATFFWIDILRDLSRGIAFPTSKAYPYAVTAVICCYLNYSGLYLILLQLVASVAFAAKKPDRRRVRRIYLTVCILYFPWLPWMLWQFICSHRMVAWIPQPSASYFLKFLSFISLGHYDATTIHNLAIFTFLVLLGFLIIKETPRTRAVADSSRLRQFLLSSQGILLLWLALPFLILFIVSLLIRPIITERYLIISLPAAYILLARSLTALPLRPIARSILGWLLILACLLHLVNGAGYYSRPQKQQLREAVSFIVQHDRELQDSLIVGYNFTGYSFWPGHYVYDYYLRRMADGRSIDLLAGTKDDLPTLPDRLERLKPARVWLISFNQLPDDEFLAAFTPDYRCVTQAQWRGSAVWLFYSSALAPQHSTD